MLIETAIELVNNLVYKPGWTFEAADHTKRFEGTILLTVHYPAHASEREEAPEYARAITTYATFPLIVRDCDDEALYRKILDAIRDIEIHEAREFLRVQPSMWAPFHPHRIDGMRRWGDVDGDLKFGIG